MWKCFFFCPLKFLKYIYCFCHLYYPYYGDSSTCVVANHYVIKGRGKNISHIKNLPGNAEQHALLMDDPLFCKLEILFRKLAGNF